MRFAEYYEDLVFLKEQEELQKMELRIQLEDHGTDADTQEGAVADQRD